MTVGYLDSDILDRYKQKEANLNNNIITNTKAQGNNDSNQEYVEFYIGTDKKSIFLYIPSVDLHVKLLEDENNVARIDFSLIGQSIIYQTVNTEENVEDSYLNIKEYNLKEGTTSEIYHLEKTDYPLYTTDISNDGKIYARGLDTMYSEVKILIYDTVSKKIDFKDIKTPRLRLQDSSTLCFVSNKYSQIWEVTESSIICLDLNSDKQETKLTYDKEIKNFVIQNDNIYAIVDNGTVNNDYNHDSLLSKKGENTTPILFDKLDKVEELTIAKDNKFIILLSRQFEDNRQKMQLYKLDVTSMNYSPILMPPSFANWWSVLGISEDNSHLFAEHYFPIQNDNYQHQVVDINLETNKAKILYEYTVGDIMND